VVIALAVVSLLLVTFSSSSWASSSSHSSLQNVSLKGAPVNIGYVDIEASLGISYAPQRIMAQQLVGYLNSKGGIGGHPIDLLTCVTAAASGGANCANKMVQDKAVLVLGNSVIDSAAMYPILKSAGIPFFGGGSSPLDAADLTPDGNHWFAGAGALVMYLTTNRFIAQNLKVKSVGLIVGSAAVAQQAAVQFIQTPLKADKVSTQIVTINESNPDYTSAVDSIMNTGALQVLTACNLQDLAIKQARTLGYKGAAIGCLTPPDLNALGKTASIGLYSAVGAVVPSLPTTATQSEIQQYLSLAHRYHWDTGQFDVETYEQVLAGVAFINKAGGASATGLEIRKTISTTTNLAVPMAPPGGLTCSKVLAPEAATACNIQLQYVQVTNRGTLRSASNWLVPPVS
jgi:ABC-type branched-subunit amino acid transport system substrate-binding protein